MEPLIRKATSDDAPAIAAIVNEFAARELMLPRSPEDVSEHLADFFVCEGAGGLGCDPRVIH